MKRLVSALALTAAVFAAGHAEAGFRSSGTMNDTAALQMRLESLGYYTGPVDGRMGPITRGALMRFQHHNGLYASGTATGETRAALFAERIAYAAPYGYNVAYVAAPVISPMVSQGATPVAYMAPVQTVTVAAQPVWPSPSSASLPATSIGYIYNPSTYNVVTGQTAPGGNLVTTQTSFYAPAPYQRVSGVNPLRGN